MKNYAKFFAVSAIGMATVFTSCEKDETTTETTTIETETNLVSQDVLDKIAALSFNTEGVTLEDYLLPDGSTEKRYIIEGDIALSPEYIENMELNGGVQSEQYRTTNLVTPGVITVLGFTGGANALSTANRNGLQFAVDNYNALNLDISLSLSFGSTNIDNFDIIVFKNPEFEAEGEAGGLAGFPMNGRPEQFVQVFGLDNASNDVNEHVIAHEIGHAIGFRHTDWFSRQSCGENTNEGAAGVGVIHIPGTPTGFDSTSIMLACVPGGTDGEFNGNDITALNFLY